MSRIRVGIAGAGWVAGARHLPSFQRHPDVDVVAVYDRSQARADDLAAKAARRDGPAVAAANSLDRFLGLGLDIVSVATSPWSHAEITIAALATGAHVFTEKPMALDSADALAMAAAASSADRLLAVSHNFLHSRSVRTADDKLVGAPVDYALGLQLSSEGRRLPSWYRGLPGGLMFDEAPHMLYCMNHFLGGGLTLDSARGTFDGDRQPRTVELLLRGATGVGQVAMVFCAPVSEWHLTLSSARRGIALDLFRDIAIDIPSDGAHRAGDIARTSAALVGGHVAGFAKAGARLVTRRQYWGHDALIAQFVDATQGRCASPVSLESSLSVVALTDAVLEALDLRVASRT